MCGICGIVDRTNKVNKQSIQTMMKLMKHRGPDDQGMLIDGNIGLGHVRLSIIDLSDKGHQPMSNDDETLWIIYNGEIYNYIELRAELKKHGVKFRSRSDTEVLLKAYEVWGEACLPKLNGMFSFIIYDKNKRILFGARDRFGIKPFHYYKTKDKFVFASEIKPILSTGVQPKPNMFAVHDFIVYRFMYHSDATFFEGIKKLEPGRFIKVNLDSTDIEIKKWWDLDTKTSEIGVEKAVAEFKKLFNDSVRIRLRSDVPVGSCLSGGLDSSAVVCTMVDILGSSKNVKTFSSTYTIDFPGDEKKYIQKVVDRTKVKSYEVEPSAENLLKKLERLIYYQEEPFLGLSPMAQWEVMKLAQKNGMKVLLDGQGGDETLAGYLGYMAFYYASLLKSAKFSTLNDNLKAYRKLHGNSYPKKELLYPLVPKNIKKRAKKKQAYFLSDQFQNSYEGSTEYFSMVDSRPLNERLRNSIKYQLVELLRFEDKSSMACSIETRLPFLDYRLVQFLFSSPDELKIRDGMTKYVFREAISGVIPDEILNRHDKIGFATPDEIWLKKESVWKGVLKLLLSKKSVSRGIYTGEGIKKLLESYHAGESEEAQKIWSLVILEMWFRMYVEGGYKQISERLE